MCLKNQTLLCFKKRIAHTEEDGLNNTCSGCCLTLQSYLVQFLSRNTACLVPKMAF